MVPVLSLWLPILLSAGAVFVISSLIHMVLGYHRHDFAKVASEDEVMEALRPFKIPPGEYIVPCAGSRKEMRSPEFMEKVKRGPVAFLTVMPGDFKMAKSLTLWFLYGVLVSVFAAYIAGRALGAGAAFPAVLRFAGCTAFAGYSLALLQNSIWYKRAWSATLRSCFDGLLYALATGALFGWLWPG